MGLARRIGRGLGEAMVTLGRAGMERQAREEQDARLAAREQAMARLNSELRSRERVEASDLEVKQQARLTPVLAERERAVGTERETFRIAEDERTAARQEQQDARTNREWDRRQQVEFNRWRQRHGIEEDTARSRELWRREQNLDTPPPARYLENAETGTYFAVGRDNNPVDTGIRFPSRRASDPLEIDEPAPAPRPRPTGTLTPRPASRNNNERPAGAPPDARRGADGQWYVTRNGRNLRWEP